MGNERRKFPLEIAWEQAGRELEEERRRALVSSMMAAAVAAAEDHRPVDPQPQSGAGDHDR